MIPRTLRESADKARDAAAATGDPTERYTALTELAVWHQTHAQQLLGLAAPDGAPPVPDAG